MTNKVYYQVIISKTQTTIFMIAAPIQSNLKISSCIILIVLIFCIKINNLVKVFRLIQLI